jgi:plasmid stabilization system protein ParE
MRKYRLSYLPLFDEDLAEAWRYIAVTLHNEEAAGTLVADVEAAILKRLKNPESFEPYRSVKSRKYPYYRINVKNFAVFYVVKGNIMEVRRFLYQRRDLHRLL